MEDGMQKWEYLIRDGLTEKNMDAYGEDGWELVTVRPDEADKYLITFYFKRPIEVEEGGEGEEAP